MQHDKYGKILKERSAENVMKDIERRYFETNAVIRSVDKLTDNTVSCIALSREIAGLAKPGQFINVQVTSGQLSAPVLRRPFAVSNVNGDEFEFIFNIVGRGTKLLYDILRSKETVNVLGPLGNGFDPGDGSRKKLLIAGGIGIAPLKSLAGHFSETGADVTLFWGNRSRRDFFGADHFENKNIKLMMSTDDGTAGFSGNVLELLKEEIKIKNIADLKEYDIYVVGPDPMMKAVAGFIEEQGARCRVSLETPMACGMGVCQGCAVRKRGSEEYKLVCKDGPVFYSDEIEFK